MDSPQKLPFGKSFPIKCPMSRGRDFISSSSHPWEWASWLLFYRAGTGSSGAANTAGLIQESRQLSPPSSLELSPLVASRTPALQVLSYFPRGSCSLGLFNVGSHGGPALSFLCLRSHTLTTTTQSSRDLVQAQGFKPRLWATPQSSSPDLSPGSPDSRAYLPTWPVQRE